MKTTRHFWLYLAHFSLEWEVFQTKVVEEIKTHILCSITFFFLNRAIYGIMWKYIVEPGRAQMTIWRMRISYFITKATDTFTVCIRYCFFTAKMFAWTRLNVTLYVHFLPSHSSHSSQDEMLILPLSVVRKSNETLALAAADRHPSWKVQYTL